MNAELLKLTVAALQRDAQDAIFIAVVALGVANIALALALGAFWKGRR